MDRDLTDHPVADRPAAARPLTGLINLDKSADPGEPVDLDTPAFLDHAGGSDPARPGVDWRGQTWRDPVRRGAAWRRWLGEARAALVVAAVTVALGGPLGLLWSALAPRVELVRGQGGWFPVAEEPEEYVAGDGWFVFLNAGLGLVVAVVAWFVVRRHRGPLILAGLAIGAIGGTVLAAWLGHRVGLGDFPQQLRDAAVGTHLDRPPRVELTVDGAKLGPFPQPRALTLAQVTVLTAVYTLLAAMHYAPSLSSDETPPAESVAGGAEPPGGPLDEGGDRAEGPVGLAGEAPTR